MGIEKQGVGGVRCSGRALTWQIGGPGFSAPTLGSYKEASALWCPLTFFLLGDEHSIKGCGPHWTSKAANAFIFD